MLYAHSYSMLTVLEIRCSRDFATESPQQRVQRLAQKYGLAERDVKLLIVTDDDRIDSYGRIAE